jgi:hypothetical protein
MVERLLSSFLSEQIESNLISLWFRLVGVVLMRSALRTGRLVG